MKNILTPLHLYAEKSPYLMKEIQLVNLDNYGFQQGGNFKFKETRAYADKEKPDAIKGTNKIQKKSTFYKSQL